MICLQCNNLFKATRNTAKFCSPKCRVAFSRGAKKVVKLGNEVYIINGTDVISKINLSQEREENGFCRIHGTPLTAAGKCLQKGCKYS